MNFKIVSLGTTFLLFSFLFSCLTASVSANLIEPARKEQRTEQTAQESSSQLAQNPAETQKALAASKHTMRLSIHIEKIHEQSRFNTSRISSSGDASKPTWRSLKNDERVIPGEVLRYTLKAENPSTKATENFTVTQPIPRQLAYVFNSAQNRTPSGNIAPNFTATYSVDNGKTFSARPLIEVEQPDGRRVQQPAPPEQYTHIRWQGDRSFPPGATALLSYQLTVR